MSIPVRRPIRANVGVGSIPAPQPISRMSGRSGKSESSRLRPAVAWVVGDLRLPGGVAIAHRVVAVADDVLGPSAHGLLVTELGYLPLVHAEVVADLVEDRDADLLLERHRVGERLLER